MPDQTARRAAWRATLVAALVAVPVALLVGFLSYGLLGSRGGGGDETTRSPRAQATGPVSMPAAPLGQRAAAVCRTLLSGLPGAIRELRRRPVTAGPDQNAAYGDPPLTVACGGPPAAYPADATLWGLSKVCWYAEERADSTVWTTVDREVPVTVTVPRDYSGPGQWVTELSAPLLATVAPAAQIPAACP